MTPAVARTWYGDGCSHALWLQVKSLPVSPVIITCAHLTHRDTLEATEGDGMIVSPNELVFGHKTDIPAVRTTIEMSERVENNVQHAHLCHDVRIQSITILTGEESLRGKNVKYPTQWLLQALSLGAPPHTH